MKPERTWSMEYKDSSKNTWRGDQVQIPHEDE